MQQVHVSSATSRSKISKYRSRCKIRCNILRDTLSMKFKVPLQWRHVCQLCRLHGGRCRIWRQVLVQCRLRSVHDLPMSLIDGPGLVLQHCLGFGHTEIRMEYNNSLPAACSFLACSAPIAGSEGLATLLRGSSPSACAFKVASAQQSPLYRNRVAFIKALSQAVRAAAQPHNSGRKAFAGGSRTAGAAVSICTVRGFSSSALSFAEGFAQKDLQIRQP